MFLDCSVHALLQAIVPYSFSKPQLLGNGVPTVTVLCSSKMSARDFHQKASTESTRVFPRAASGHAGVAPANGRAASDSAHLLA